MPDRIAALDSDDIAAAAAVLERAWPGRGAAAVCAEKLLAPGAGGEPTTLGVVAGGRLAGIAAVAGPYLRVLAVDPRRRGAGIGTALLERAAEIASGPLIAAAEPGNYLTPGIDASDRQTRGWLERRGFVAVGDAANLVIDVVDNPRVSRARLEREVGRLAAAGYRLGRAGDADRAALIAGQPRGWVIEIERALGPPSGVWMARDAAGELVGFAVRDGNNRGLGGFGPAAVAPGHRNRGLGAALLLCCLLDVADAGRARCTVGWVGPRGFYQRAVGIAGEQRYTRMRRQPLP